jgi:hypothetical protein
MSAIVRPRWIRGIAWIALLAYGFQGGGRAEQGASSPPVDTGTRRAVLVGIDDYSASRLPRPAGGGTGPPGAPDLYGAVNDVRTIGEILVALYGFASRGVLTLTDQAATRAAILRALDERLVQPTRPGDVVLFYFSGHGSQVANTRSDEPDGLDESIVPADRGPAAPDIRDKELRRIFNRILDRGARLTVVLDSCHSGSGARNPDGPSFRRAAPDGRDVKDGPPYGPRPEDRGALVLSAAQDLDLAWESDDEHGRPHGAFSLALARSMRDATAGESAAETFRRAHARLQAEKRFQEPVLGGNGEATRAPLLGSRADGHARGRKVVAVERVEGNGTVMLQGGWADGLTPGSELRLLAGGPGPAARLRVTAVPGLSSSEAVVVPANGPAAPDPRPGALAEVVAWAPAPGPPLRVWVSQISGGLAAAAGLAAELAREAPRRGVRWIVDPTEETPAQVLRWRDEGWELEAACGDVERLGSRTDAGAVLAMMARAQESERCRDLARGAHEKRPSLYVQVPAPASLVRDLGIGPGTDRDGIEPVAGPAAATYVLAGRVKGGGVEYAWLRPGAGPPDRRRSVLPVHTRWVPLAASDAANGLVEDVLRLRQIHDWQQLDSPAGAGFPYELAVREEDSRRLASGNLTGRQRYDLVLRAKQDPPPAAVEPRYVYAFVIDSDGKSVLLFPTAGGVENRFPLRLPGRPPVPPQREIPLGYSSFVVTEPFGVDTYFLLATDEPLPDPWVLEWKGVRAHGLQEQTPLAKLLASTGGARRSAAPAAIPAAWSIERTPFVSVDPGTAPAAGRR